MDCTLKKNANSPKCKKAVGEAHFTIIVPKADNSGNKIKPSYFEKEVNKIHRRFGGTTTKPITLGCWQDEKRKELQCETGFAIETFRDFDSDSELKGYNATRRQKQLKNDYAFLRRLAKRFAVDLGQDSIPVIFDNISDVSLNKGMWKKKIEKNKLTGKKIKGDPWKKYI